MIKSRCCDMEIVKSRCSKCGRWTGRNTYFTYDTEKGKQPLPADIQSLIDELNELYGRGG